MRGSALQFRRDRRELLQRRLQVIGNLKTEVIWRRGPCRHVEAVEFATLEWVDWFNNRRLLDPIGLIPPAEFEQAYYRSNEPHAMVA